MDIIYFILGLGFIFFILFWIVRSASNQGVRRFYKKELEPKLRLLNSELSELKRASEQRQSTTEVSEQKSPETFSIQEK